MLSEASKKNTYNTDTTSFSKYLVNVLKKIYYNNQKLKHFF